MKRLIVALLCVAMLPLAIAAHVEGNWYVTEGKDLVSRIRELTQDEAYCQIYTVMNESVQKWLETIRNADLEAPVAARAIYVGEKEELLATLEKASPITGEDSFEAIVKLSDTAKDELVKRLPSALVNLVNARLGGESWLMMGSMVGTGRGYVAPEGFRPCVLMLTYPGEIEAIVSFLRSGEGVVGASATIVPPGSAAFIEEYLDKADSYGIAFESEELSVE